MVEDAYHWRGKGVFEGNEEGWLQLGREHLDLVNSYACQLDLKFPVDKIVEWGCGGGANAVHFGSKANKYFGIDINPESLSECTNQMSNFGYRNFHPFLIDTSNPEKALVEDIKDSDFFICTYVYELLPSPEYGLRILELANRILKINGIGFIQIKYNSGERKFRSRKWGYKLNPYNMTTYTIEEFWNHTLAFGFQPYGVYLMPKQEIVSDYRYAYYFLKKVNHYNPS